MSFDDWKACVEPKVHGSWNLHSLLPRGLDFFVALSSVCGIIGQGGQANYAAGNTYLDALASYRISRGEKAASIDLGPMLSEGVLAENKDLMDRFIRTGTLNAVSQQELFALLDHFCDPSLELPSLTTANCQTITGIKLPASLRSQGIDEPSWMRQPMFRHLHQIDETGASSSSTAADQALDLATAFSKMASVEEAGSLVAQELAKRLGKILGIPAGDIDLDKPMHTYGLDSLVAVELRNWFVKELDADIAIFEILGGATFATAGISAAGKSRFRQATWTAMEA